MSSDHKPAIRRISCWTTTPHSICWHARRKGELMKLVVDGVDRLTWQQEPCWSDVLQRPWDTQWMDLQPRLWLPYLQMVIPRCLPLLPRLLIAYQGQRRGQVCLHQISLSRHPRPEAVHRAGSHHDLRREPRLRQAAALGSHRERRRNHLESQRPDHATRRSRCKQARLRSL